MAVLLGGCTEPATEQPDATLRERISAELGKHGRLAGVTILDDQVVTQDEAGANERDRLLDSVGQALGPTEVAAFDVERLLRLRRAAGERCGSDPAGVSMFRLNGAPSLLAVSGCVVERTLTRQMVHLPGGDLPADPFASAAGIERILGLAGTVLPAGRLTALAAQWIGDHPERQQPGQHPANEHRLRAGGADPRHHR